MSRHWLSRVSQRNVQRGANFGGRNGAVNLLAVDEESWGRVDTKSICFFHGCSDGILILRFDTRLQLRRIQIMFLSLLHDDSVNSVEACGRRVLAVHFALVRVDVV